MDDICSALLLTLERPVGITYPPSKTSEVIFDLKVIFS